MAGLKSDFLGENPEESHTATNYYGTVAATATFRFV